MSRGVYYMIFAVCLLALQQIGVKILNEISVYQIVFFRALISLIISAAILKQQKHSFKGENYPLLIFRGIVGTFSLVTFFYTLHHIPLATAVTIGHLSPLFLGLLAFTFLKEKFSKINWIALLLCFSGVLIIKGFDFRISALNLIIAVLSAMLAGLAHFFVRLLRHENPLNVLFYFSLIMLLLLSPVVFYTWKMPSHNEWIIMVIIGVISHYAQLFLTKALKEEEVSKVGGIYYLGIIIAILTGVFLFEETFNIETVIGMLLIVTGFMLEYLIKKTLQIIKQPSV